MQNAHKYFMQNNGKNRNSSQAVKDGRKTIISKKQLKRYILGQKHYKITLNYKNNQKSNNKMKCNACCNVLCIMLIP